MCIGIAIVGVVPEDGTPIQFYGRSGNSSHDTLLSESVPVELHNRSFKIEFIFPDSLRLDAPDEVCRSQAQDLGIAEIKFGVAVLKPDVFLAACKWLREHSLEHDIKTMQGAYLQGAYLRGADLQGADLRGADLLRADLLRADLRGADLRGADLQGAYLQGAYLRGADLQGADLLRADLLRADLRGADLRGAYLQGAYLQGAYLQGAYLSDEQKIIAKDAGALVVA